MQGAHLQSLDWVTLGVARAAQASQRSGGVEWRPGAQLLLGGQWRALPAQSRQQIGLLQVLLLLLLHASWRAHLLCLLCSQVGGAVGQTRRAASIALLLLLLVLLLLELLLVLLLLELLLVLLLLQLHQLACRKVCGRHLVLVACLEGVQQRRLLLSSHGTAASWGGRRCRLVQQPELLQLEQLLRAQARACHAAGTVGKPQACNAESSSQRGSAGFE